MAHGEVDDLVRIVGNLRLFWFGLVFDFAVWGCLEELFEGVRVVVGFLRASDFLHVKRVLALLFEELLFFQVRLTSCERCWRFDARAARIDLSGLRRSNGRPESALLLRFFELDLVGVLVHSLVLDHILIHGPIGKTLLSLLHNFQGPRIQFRLEIQAFHILVFVGFPQLVFVVVVFRSIAVHYVGSGL